MIIHCQSGEGCIAFYEDSLLLEGLNSRPRINHQLDNMTSTYKLTFIFSLLSLGVFAVSANYTSNAVDAFNVLQEWYNPDSGLWDTMGWWNGANGMTAIAGLQSAVENNFTLLQEVTSVFETTYELAPAMNPGGQDANGCSGWCSLATDDNAWWALAWVAAYDITQQNEYLTIAEEIYINMTGGGTTNCGGGIYWGQDNTYVNAIVNELYLSVAAHLANRPTSSNINYTSVAQTQWNWFKNSGMINQENLIKDGLTAACTNNGKSIWTYNQGVVLGGLVELNKAAPNQSYLAAAHTIATAAIAHFTDANLVLHETACTNGETGCDGNQTQFKGIFVRNLLMLHQAEPRGLYKQFILANAQSIWANDQDATTGQLGVNWAEFVNDANASTHSSALDALIAAIVV